MALAALCGAAASGLASPAFAAGYLYTTIATSVPIPLINPPAGSILNFPLAPSINDKGFVAYPANAACPAPSQTTFSCGAVYTTFPSGTPNRIANGGGAQPLPVQRFYDAMINPGGAVSFGVQNVTSGPTPTASSNWLSLWKNGDVRAITPIAAINGANLYANPRILSNSRVLYGDSSNQTLMLAQKGKAPRSAAPGACTLTNGTGSGLNGVVAYRGGNAGSGPCVEAGILVTDTRTGATTLRVPADGTYGTLFSTVTTNAAGTVAFGTRNLPNRPTRVDGLFVQKAGGPVQKIAEIDNGQCADAPTQGTPCQYRTYDLSLAINAKGLLAPNIRISDWSSAPNPVNAFGVALNGDIQNGKVAWPGMVIDGCNVRQALVGPRSINKFGQIALLLTCTVTGNTTYQAVVIATPSAK
jgi:hypothetical protein